MWDTSSIVVELSMDESIECIEALESELWGFPRGDGNLTVISDKSNELLSA